LARTHRRPAVTCRVAALFRGDGPPCRPFRIVSCPTLRVGALLLTDVSDVLPLLLLYSPLLEHRHARKTSNQALIAIVKFEGFERNNSTHRPHTHIYMLSRVAAVMAPRTHNRRGVTGSGGRRREGGESERQRPNMSRRVFTSAVLLLLVVTMCCTGEAAAAGGGKSSIAINPFTGTTRIDATWQDDELNTESASLRVPSLVEVQGHVFAIAEAHCKDGDKCSKVGFTRIASKYLDLNVVS
ncbi:trans-sialidase, putative, partial [Trypanosoma cruzi]